MHFFLIPLFAIIHRWRGDRFLGMEVRWLAYGIPATLIIVAALTSLPFLPVLAFSLAYMLRWNLPHGPFFTLGKGQANNRPSPPAFRFFDKIKHALPNDYLGSIAVLLIMDLPFLIAGIVAGHPLAGLLAMLGSTGTYVFWFTLPLHDRGIDPTRYAEWTGGAVYGAFLLALIG
ncbi:MAG: hypothetical protein COB49_02005 [Alphaproteobacteria bacterium]|nr:MAG: hypothetical protein COB49_02005 [Alphaproteobacteria bacterium]